MEGKEEQTDLVHAKVVHCALMQDATRLVLRPERPLFVGTTVFHRGELLGHSMCLMEDGSTTLLLSEVVEVLPQQGEWVTCTDVSTQNETMY